MFGTFGFNELLILMLVIAILSSLGIWPHIVRGLRELRGERVEDDHAAPASRNPDLELCFKMLGLSPSASMAEVERAFREKAKIHHPDRGGDEDTMRALNDAYSRIKQVRLAGRR